MNSTRAIPNTRPMAPTENPCLVPQVRVRSWDANLGITVRGASLEMQRTYRLLFVFENLVRQFIDQRFVEEDKKPDWWDGRATAAMKKKVEDRKREEEKNSWHAATTSHCSM